MTGLLANFSDIEILHIRFAIKDCLIDKDNIIVLWKFKDKPNHTGRETHNIYSLRAYIASRSDLDHSNGIRLLRSVLQEFEKMRNNLNKITLIGR